MSFYTKGFEKGKDMPGTTSVVPRSANRFYLPEGKSTKLVLLDDVPVNIYEHGVYLRGDKNVGKLKVTCTSPAENPVPDKCQCCGAMIHDQRIYRKFTAFLSSIDLSTFTIEGTTYTHTRKLIPMNAQAFKKLMKRKEKYGSLVGMVFEVTRNERTSPAVGDDWVRDSRVKLAEFFRNSPRIAMIQKYYEKQGKKVSADEALKLLIAPFDYAKELEPNEQRTRYFLGYLGVVSAPVTDPGTGNKYDYGNGDAAKEAASPAEGEEDFSEWAEGDEAPEAPPVKKSVKLNKFGKPFKKVTKSPQSEE